MNDDPAVAADQGQTVREFHALRVQGQPFGEFFLCSLPADLLVRVSYSDYARARRHGDSYAPEGTERGHNTKRLQAISEFINSRDCAFPSSIILAANYDRESGILDADDKRRWRFDGHEQLAKITVPTTERVVSIIDGQHRILGLERAGPGPIQSMELPCVIYPDLPNPLQAYIFATVNFNQKKVDRSLAFELFGFDTSDDPKTWPPEKLAVFIARYLHSDEKSPLRGRVKLSLRDETGIGSKSQDRIIANSFSDFPKHFEGLG